MPVNCKVPQAGKKDKNRPDPDDYDDAGDGDEESGTDGWYRSLGTGGRNGLPLTISVTVTVT